MGVRLASLFALSGLFKTPGALPADEARAGVGGPARPAPTSSIEQKPLR